MTDTIHIPTSQFRALLAVAHAASSTVNGFGILDRIRLRIAGRDAWSVASDRYVAAAVHVTLPYEAPTEIDVTVPAAWAVGFHGVLEPTQDLFNPNDEDAFEYPRTLDLQSFPDLDDTTGALRISGNCLSAMCDTASPSMFPDITSRVFGKLTDTLDAAPPWLMYTRPLRKALDVLDAFTAGSFPAPAAQWGLGKAAQDAVPPHIARISIDDGYRSLAVAVMPTGEDKYGQVYPRATSEAARMPAPAKHRQKRSEQVTA